MEPRGRDHRGRRLRRPGRCAAPSSASRPEHPPLPLPASPSAAAGRCRRRRRPQSPPGARRPPSRRARSVFWLRRPSQAPLPRPPRRPAGGSIGVGSTDGARNGSASGLSGRRGRDERRARPAVEPVRRHAIRAGSIPIAARAEGALPGGPVPGGGSTRSARGSVSTLTSLRPGGRNPRRPLRFARGRPADQRGRRGAASTSPSTFSSVTRASSCLRVSSMSW